MGEDTCVRRFFRQGEQAHNRFSKIQLESAARHFPGLRSLPDRGLASISRNILPHRWQLVQATSYNVCL